MLSTVRSFFTVLVVACLSQASVAQPSGIYVEFYSVTNPIDGWAAFPGYPDRHASPVQPGLPSGSSVTITNANDLTYRVFAVSASTTDIGSIFIGTSNPNTQPALLVGTGFTIPLSAARLPAAGARNLASITYGTGRPRVQVFVTGNITGGIDAWQVVRVDADGAILGGIFHNPDGVSPAPALGYVAAGSIGPNGNVNAFRGDVNHVEAVGAIEGQIESQLGSVISVLTTGGGSLRANLLAPAGSIGTVTIQGDIGTSTSPRLINAKTGIQSVQAQNIYATINANANGGIGNL